MMGLKLRRTFIDAGVPGPKMLVTGCADGGPESPAYEYVCAVLRSLLPAAERFGIVRPEEVLIDSLAGRLRDEATAGGGVILPPLFIGGWATTPA